MKYFSTRNSNEKVSASWAISHGLAPDGGLYVPESLPMLSLDDIKTLGKKDYRGRALSIMKPFLDEFTEDELKAMILRAYGHNFDSADTAPVHFLDEKTAVLELWHGPTCAFKDMALQMLPHLLTASLKKCGERRKVCILVATSGDTGKAALEGFADVENTKILVFYPHNGVSDVQQLQMVTQTGDNVGVAAVRGNFDDAQTGVKQIFGDAAFAEQLSAKGWFLSSANSINWGRLLPQIVYYFSAYCDYANSGRVNYGDAVDFVVPTGNFGNILACWYAKNMGLPVGKLICASNQNNVLADFFSRGVYDRNRTFYTTISPSMDILISSNLERLLYHLCGDAAAVADLMKRLKTDGRYAVPPEMLAKLQSEFYGGFCDDAATAATIGKLFREHNYLCDTHTGVAVNVYEQYRKETGDDTPCVIASTASPYKFAAAVLPAVYDGAVPESGFDQVAKLSEVTGTPVPAPLAGLKNRPVLHKSCTEKEEMSAFIRGFLESK